MPPSYFLLVDEDTGGASREELPDIVADTRDWAFRLEQFALSCCDRRDRIRQVCSRSPSSGGIHSEDSAENYRLPEIEPTNTQSPFAEDFGGLNLGYRRGVVQPVALAAWSNKRFDGFMGQTTGPAGGGELISRRLRGLLSVF